MQEVRFVYEHPGLVHILKPVTITRADRVQDGLSPIKLEESRAERHPDNHGGDKEGTKEPSEPVPDVDCDDGEVEGGSEGGD